VSAQPRDVVRRLPDAGALRALAGDDVYVRTSLDDAATRMPA